MPWYIHGQLWPMRHNNNIISQTKLKLGRSVSYIWPGLLKYCHHMLFCSRNDLSTWDQVPSNSEPGLWSWWLGCHASWGDTQLSGIMFCISGRGLLVLMSVGMSAVSGDGGSSVDHKGVCPVLSKSVCGTGHRRTHVLQQEQSQLWQGVWISQVQCSHEVLQRPGYCQWALGSTGTLLSIVECELMTVH